MSELADKNTKAMIIIVFYMVRKVKQRCRRYKKTQVKPLQKKIQCITLKSALDENDRTLDIAEKNSDLEYITTETIQNEKVRENKIQF